MAANPTHGTHSAYFNGCRCDKCVEAARVFRNEGTHARYIAGQTSVPPLFLPHDRTTAYDDTDQRHGGLTAYTQGCRCPWCKEAGKAYRTHKKLGIPLPKGFNARYPEETHG